ncbi:substrate-binding domain-containing protein [Kitasatospora purpeofusca]|uniref:substrate-binding domain-containing protein n=1 Tax=Kitasatospora purpeofusca TaxID=67352 RepID=UPI0036D30170
MPAAAPAEPTAETLTDTEGPPSMRKAFARLTASTALATSFVMVGGLAAADPVVPPRAEDIVGLGADITAPLFNRLSTDYNAFLAASGDSTSPRLYSWDTKGGPSIVPKAGAGALPRSIGSNAGILALENTTTELDFARSARPAANGSDRNTDTFVTFAKDAVSWAAKAGGHAPADLTTAQLKDIYTCYKTNWRQIDPTLPDATIKPFLPRWGNHLSDTGERFLKAIGGAVAIPPGACVGTVDTENAGTDPLLNNDDAVVPYALSRYISQTYFGHTSGADAPGPLTVRSIGGKQPVDVVEKAIGAGFLNSPYEFRVSNVVRDEQWRAADARGAALRAVFAMDGWLCTDPVARATVKSHGFTPTPGCGSAINPVG